VDIKVLLDAIDISLYDLNIFRIFYHFSADETAEIRVVLFYQIEVNQPEKRRNGNHVKYRDKDNVRIDRGLDC
jgi:hypothetical protein